MNISGSILHSAKARHGHCWGLPQPVALASAMNLFSSDMSRMLHPRLVWLGSASVLFLLILKWGATLSCLPKDIWSRGIGTGLAQVAQAAAQDPGRAALGLCFFFVSLLQKGRLRLIRSAIQQMYVKKKTGGHSQR